MLETVDLGRRLSKDDYRQRAPRLQERFYELQRACLDAGLPPPLAVEGGGGAAPGTLQGKSPS